MSKFKVPKENEKKIAIKEQVEYYLSDENLKKDQIRKYNQGNDIGYKRLVNSSCFNYILIKKANCTTNILT